MVLVEPALGFAEESLGVRQPFREGVQALRATLNDRPFGDPKEIAAAAIRLKVASESLIDALNASRFDRSTPSRLLADLVELQSLEFPDYDSARQLAWAVRSVYADGQHQSLNRDIMMITNG